MSEFDTQPTPSTNNTAVKVICRLRPPLAHEPQKKTVEVLEGREIRITDPVKKLINRFDFSACYDENSTQQEIFDNEVRDMVLGIFSGISASIFTFGCTGSGKTHTLQGSPTDQGITPRTARAIFKHISELKAQHGNSAQYITTMSCFEIWKDKVWDLLNEAGTSTTRDVGKGDLNIREATNGQVFVSNLRKIPLYTINDFERLYEKAMRSRSTSSTKLNHTSSRSHAILNLNVTQLRGGRTYEGKCVLIDLAGSENNKKTGNEENRERMKESVEINQSLLALRKVVRSLNAGENRIPYRDSKLTRILSDSLGGRSVALVICNVAPSPYQYRDTMNTLNFGSLTRNVENKVVVKDREDKSSKEDVDIASNLAPPTFYQNSHLNKSAPQLPTSTTPKISSDGYAVPCSYKPKLSTRPSLAVLQIPRSRIFASSTSANRMPSDGGSPQVPEIPGTWRKPVVPATKPLTIKKKTSLTSSPPFGTSLRQAFDQDRALGGPKTSNGDQGSTGGLEKQVSELLQRNMDAMVEKRLDALLATKIKEAGLLDFGGPQTPRSQSSNTSLTTTERDTDLVDRITHLEDQFQRENQQFIEHSSHTPAAIQHPNTLAESTFTNELTTPFLKFLSQQSHRNVISYPMLSFLHIDFGQLFPFLIL